MNQCDMSQAAIPERAVSPRSSAKQLLHELAIFHDQQAEKMRAVARMLPDEMSEEAYAGLTILISARSLAARTR